jgi:hypothetical protein
MKPPSAVGGSVHGQGCAISECKMINEKCKMQNGPPPAPSAPSLCHALSTARRLPPSDDATHFAFCISHFSLVPIAPWTSRKASALILRDRDFREKRTIAKATRRWPREIVPVLNPQCTTRQRSLNRRGALTAQKPELQFLQGASRIWMCRYSICPRSASRPIGPVSGSLNACSSTSPLHTQ